MTVSGRTPIYGPERWTTTRGTGVELLGSVVLRRRARRPRRRPGRAQRGDRERRPDARRRHGRVQALASASDLDQAAGHDHEQVRHCRRSARRAPVARPPPPRAAACTASASAGCREHASECSLSSDGEERRSLRPAPSGCRDRTHRRAQCRRGRRGRIGLPQTRRGEARLNRTVVPELVHTGSGR